MPRRRRANLNQIKKDLGYLSKEPDPNKCACRNVRCCEREGHAPGWCAGLRLQNYGRFGGSILCGVPRIREEWY
jgi:hypothetical protein